MAKLPWGAAEQDFSGMVDLLCYECDVDIWCDICHLGLFYLRHDLLLYAIHSIHDMVEVAAPCSFVTPCSHFVTW
jgi:hypothetical protein